MALVYRALFPSGKSYIGVTTRDFETRKTEHLCHGKSRNNKFHNAIKKYGPESILWEILIEVEESDLSTQEIKFIQQYDAYKNGYNSTLGGEISCAKDLLVRAKMKANYTRSWLGRKHTPETRLKMSANNRRTILGKKLSEETRQKMREARARYLASKVGE